jgi:type I restriction enzyme R subunit
LNKLHALRILGNKGAHSLEIEQRKAHEALLLAFDISRWLYFSRHKSVGLPQDFLPVPKPEIPASAEKLFQMEEALRIALEQRDAAKAALSAAEADLLAQQATSAVTALQFNEADTRKYLINTMLIEAGWDVNNDHEISVEYPIPHQPTETGYGKADYVLWDDDGKPLAVIEAKKTAVSVEKGKVQARIYADGLEKAHQCRPVIFYTNGFETMLWDDRGGPAIPGHLATGYPPRRVFGFPSKDSLQFMIKNKRDNMRRLDGEFKKPRPEIAGRPYQVEAVARICERFDDARHRKALIVQATGTGKTRVAVAIAELLMRAGWAKRVLFLCDRVELRKQARNAFNQFLPTEPLVIASRTPDKHARIHLATYPAMMKLYNSFDIGFFDLVIADESHRSIYNKYRDIFLYFDALQIGLTATPRDIISHNTFKFFECNDQEPTAFYDYDDAVNEGHLVPFRVFEVNTKFQRQGIKYKDLTPEQKIRLEEDGFEPEQFDYDAKEMDSRVYNMDCNREILKNIMEHGLRDATGQRPGKTIIFARNHIHADLLAQLFRELYPQYGGDFCAVIDTYNPRADQVLDDFKNSDKHPIVAVSVDMLDTGIDIPEVVNLVFAKPVKSLVKFWQMIGRGTRLCPNLFGPGRDKKEFWIFDHWQNFEFFGQEYEKATVGGVLSLLERLFATRLELMEIAMLKADTDTFDRTVPLLREMIAALPEQSMAVKEKIRQKHLALNPGVLEAFKPETVQALKRDMQPLMRHVPVQGQKDSLIFDELAARLQIELLRKSLDFEKYRNVCLERLGRLQGNLNPVREKAEKIAQVKGEAFWTSATPTALETMRKDLRGIMQYMQPEPFGPGDGPLMVDIKSDGLEFHERDDINLPGWDMRAYREKVQEVIAPLIESDPTVRKIRQADPLTEADFTALASLVLTQNRNVDLNTLREFYPTVPELTVALRGIVGLDAATVDARFEAFIQRYPTTAMQTAFLRMLKAHLSEYGVISIERLYENPFTSLAPEGPEGVFADPAQLEEFFHIIGQFTPTVSSDVNKDMTQ